MSETHILVCLSSSPTNGKIIRVAAQMAKAYDGTLTALYVETPDYKVMSEENKARLRENTLLAEHLGATVETVYGSDIPFQIAEYARLSGATKIVMGRSNMRRKYIWSKPPLVERLINLAPDLDIHIIPDRDVSNYRIRKLYQADRLFRPDDMIKSLLLLMAATAVGGIFRYMNMSDSNIVMIYIICVLLTAAVTSRMLYSLVMSMVSVLAFNYFFTVPYFTLKAYSDDYPVTFLTMLLAAFITSTLAGRMKQQMAQASEAAYRTKILLETNQMIQQKSDRQEMVSVVAGQLMKLLRRDIIYYPVEKGQLQEAVIFFCENGEKNPKYGKEDYLTASEREVAEWVLRHNRHAGATTDVRNDARCLYLAIRTGDRAQGVIGIPISGEPLETFENSITLSILGECALALEKETALREREKSALLAKNEQLRANLLRSISHDLRTPLTSISGNAGVLLANPDGMDGENRKKLYANIYDDSLWLINLVENLLSVTKIEDGTVKLHKSTELIDEMIQEALQHVNLRKKDHKIILTPSEDFLLVKADARLIMQVISNIVDNAVKYTPPGSEIRISAFRQNGMVSVEIADNGNGISDEEKPQIFDRFYVAGHGVVDSRRSLGLGLSLCKSIITAHGGMIEVRDNKPRGAVFRFTLPEEEVTLRE
ncbi:MAG: DUF4118 domain-containing protein [Lachnospiraceae bacterium]|nr:DUF4118 domain-containing protein [Lachnospiraceae bacterium]